MNPFDRLIRASLVKDISHGDFRLYAILTGASARGKSDGTYFQVTLEGLMKLHPGIAGRPAGATTIIKQMSSLRGAGLLEIKGAVHRESPRTPVLVKVLNPAPQQRNLATVVNTQ